MDIKILLLIVAIVFTGSLMIYDFFIPEEYIER